MYIIAHIICNHPQVAGMWWFNSCSSNLDACIVKHVIQKCSRNETSRADFPEARFRNTRYQLGCLKVIYKMKTQVTSCDVLKHCNKRTSKLACGVCRDSSRAEADRSQARVHQQRTVTPSRQLEIPFLTSGYCFWMTSISYRLIVCRSPTSCQHLICFTNELHFRPSFVSISNQSYVLFREFLSLTPGRVL